MSYVNLLILSFFDMFMLVCIVFSLKFSSEKITVLKGIVSVLMGSVLIGTSGYLIANQPISVTINITIAFLIIKFITNGRIKEVIILYIFSLTIIYSIQLVVTIILKIIFDNFEYSFIFGLISQIITTTVVILLLLVIPLYSIYLYVTERNKLFQIITINMFAIYYVLLMLWYTNLNGFFESILGVIVLVFSILVVNAIILSNGLQNQATLEKMNIYDTYLPIIEDVIEQIRAKQHDYHNHIQALESLQVYNTTDINIQNYKNQVLKEEIWTKLIKMNNKILIAFLYNRYINALSVGVSINYIIDNYLLKTNYTDYELVELFGILIDNSLEATQRINETSMELFIGYKDGMNIIQTKNKSYEVSSEEIKQMFGYKYTWKKSQVHGIGLYKIQKLLRKNNGTITVYYDTHEKEIVFTVKLPNSFE